MVTEKGNPATMIQTLSKNQDKGRFKHTLVDDKEGFTWQAGKSPAPGTREVTVRAADIPGLFSRTVGCFTLNGLDICEARSYRQQSRTLDIFTVRPLSWKSDLETALDKARADLSRAVSGGLDLARTLQGRGRRSSGRTHPPQVRADDEASLLFTRIDVLADDRPGLLFAITDTLFSLGLDVWTARIQTIANKAKDQFDVRQTDGVKPKGQPWCRRIAAELEARLSRL